jgi:hypothetical protein
MEIAMGNKSTDFEITYGIYTIERLPKGSRRSPKWDLHSTAQDRLTAENHAKILSAQPYFDHIEVQEFRVCPKTKDRKVIKIRSYSRQSSKIWTIGLLIFFMAIAAILIF